MSEADKDVIVIENYQPQRWEWTDDFSKFGKDGWNYVREWPDGRAELGRKLPTD